MRCSGRARSLNRWAIHPSRSIRSRQPECGRTACGLTGFPRFPPRHYRP
jgi:hypothetical protein